MTNTNETKPPLPSRATRDIAKRSKASSRGAIVAKLPADARPRIIQFESKLEQRVLYLFLANKQVYDIWEQPPFVTYFDDDGKCKMHFFDFLVRLRNGRRLAVAVKPAVLAKRRNFVRDLRCIRRAVHKDYADEVVLITDRDFAKEEAMNAQRFVEFSLQRETCCRAELEQIIKSTVFPVSVGQLVEKLKLGGQGYREVFIAIFEGLLTADKTQLIDMDTLVIAGGET